MAWHWPGNKPLSEPMMVSLLMHICFTQPQWVKPTNMPPNLLSQAASEVVQRLLTTGLFFFIVWFYFLVYCIHNIFVWNWSNRIHNWSALWILMAWCFHTRASIATVLSMYTQVSRGPFYLHGLTLISAWIINHIHYNVWDEIHS